MTAHKLRPTLEALEDRCVPSSGYRPIDEVGNNISNPTWGVAGTDLLRLSPVAYADGISSPSLPNNPGARVVSDLVSNQADAAGNDIQTVDTNSLSDFGYVWGQFIDHDMDLTPSGSGQFDNILADPNDPSQMATQTFERSSYDPTTGTSTSTPRQQINAITSYLDLSQVYGSNDTVANALRTFSGGQLKTSPGDMLPYNNTTYFTVQQLAALNMANDPQAVPSTSLFAAGDLRANENIELTALQTLFVRNHNRIAAELQAEHPNWNDEQLYQEARKINIATEEMITYNNYLPDLLGKNALPAYVGYTPTVDPAIATEFSTVAFRFGHSLLSNQIQRQDNNGNAINDPAGAPINLAFDFFDPTLLNPTPTMDPMTGQTSTDIDPILKGDADGNSQAMNLLAINEIRNLLFANGTAMDNGQDLIARDIQRARDDGIGTYNQVREAFGLPPVTSFAQITSNVAVQNELKVAYGTVDNIDSFIGGLAEDHVPGSDLGPLFQAALVDQFTRLRSGDRYFYLNEKWTPDELNILNQAPTLGKVIEANTGVTNLQADVFTFTASISGTVLVQGGRNDPPGNAFGHGLTGITIQLQDTSGDVLATTTTDKHGNYTFTQQSGPSNNPEIAYGASATGKYEIVPILPSYLRFTSPSPITVDITRGGLTVANQDVGVDFSLPGGGWDAHSLPSTQPSDNDPSGSGHEASDLNWHPANPNSESSSSASDSTVQSFPPIWVGQTSSSKDSGSQHSSNELVGDCNSENNSLCVQL
jgi:hypothetical protein